MNYYKNLNFPYPVNNPSDSERYEMVKYVLQIQNRNEDFSDIIDLMKPPKEITGICQAGSGKNIKVAVIGAGESGLAACFELRKIGCSITLFEASQRIGGRVYTHYFDRVKKQYGELGPMMIPSSHETTWHYINLFNLRTSPFVNNNENTLFYIRNKSASNDYKGRNVAKKIYPEFSLKEEEKMQSWIDLNEEVYLKYLSKLTSDDKRELLEIKSQYSKNIAEMDKLTLRNAYEKLNYSEELTEILTTLDGNNQFLNSSFIEMLQRYYTVDSKYSYYINDGMISLPYSLYKAVCSKNEDVYKDIPKDKLGNVEVKMGFPVNGIYDSDSKDKVILKYTDYGNKEETFEEFDYVVCAIPFSSLRRIDINPMPTIKKRQAITKMSYETAQKMYLYLKERFWERGNISKRILGGHSLTDLPLVATYYPCDHAKPSESKLGKWILKSNMDKTYEDSGAILASYSWGQDAVRLGCEDPELQIRDAVRYLERLHDLPEHYIDNNIIDYKSLIWSDVQYIWGSGALLKPGEKTLLADAAGSVEMEDKMFFAGEHVSRKHVSQQGALQSGMIAANCVAERIAER